MMVKKITIISVLVLSIATLTLASCGTFKEYDKPEYRVEAQSHMQIPQNIEFRKYKDAVVAEVTTTGSRDAAANAAFRVLFKYITGNNIAQDKIDMTSPVTQEQTSQKIDMTSPVAQESLGQNKWRTAFYMPKSYTIDTIPKPKDKRVTVRVEAGRHVAAIKFTGLWTDKNYKQHEKKLRDFLDAENISYNPIPVYAYYDPPFKPWFMRRNEIIFTLDIDEKTVQKIGESVGPNVPAVPVAPVDVSP